MRPRRIACLERQPAFLFWTWGPTSVHHTGAEVGSSGGRATETLNARDTKRSTWPWGGRFPSLVPTSCCWGRSHQLWEGPVFPLTVVSHSAIAALPFKSMRQLIWLDGLEKMKYDRVAIAPQQPGPSPDVQDDECIEIAFKSHNHGKHGRAPPSTQITLRSSHNGLFPDGPIVLQCVWGPTSWEHGSTTIYCWKGHLCDLNTK